MSFLITDQGASLLFYFSHVQLGFTLFEFCMIASL